MPWAVSKKRPVVSRVVLLVLIHVVAWVMFSSYCPKSDNVVRSDRICPAAEGSSDGLLICFPDATMFDRSLSLPICFSVQYNMLFTIMLRVILMIPSRIVQHPPAFPGSAAGSVMPAASAHGRISINPSWR